MGLDMEVAMRIKRVGLWRKLQGERGQSMVSYAVIVAMILGGLITMSMVILPEMMRAYGNFTQSVYFCINFPF